MRVYQQIASSLDAYRYCLERHGKPGWGHLSEWIDKHANRAFDATHLYLPEGSGFDGGTNLEIDKCTDDKLVFSTAFHHMDEFGYYDGWTNHTVTVRASLVHGITIKVSGRDKNNIKDYIAECFDQSLRMTIVAEPTRVIGEV